MARIRTIKPEFPQSESMGRVSREARLLFIMLWTICDDEGRGRGNSKMLASLLYPYDEDAPALIDGWMGELEAESCVVRYSGPDGASYFVSTNWSKHQRIDKPGKSKCPPPPPEIIRERSRGLPEASRKLLVGSRTKEGIEGSEEGNSVPSGQPPSAAPTRPVSPDDKTWLFNEGLELIEQATGKPSARVRSLIGKWLKELSDDCGKLRAVFEAAAQAEPIDAVSWITAAVAARKAAPAQLEGEGRIIWNWRLKAYGWRRHGIWAPDAGPNPDEPGNDLPKSIAAEFPPLRPGESKKLRMPEEGDPAPEGWPS